MNLTNLANLADTEVLNPKESEMTINLFANVLNNDAIDNLTEAQADAVLAMFDKPKPRVEPIDRATIERAQDIALTIIADHKEA